MNGIGNRNRINSDFKIQLLGAGFKAWGGYNTIGINIRGNASTIIPKSIFDITKNGLKNQTYDISDLNAATLPDTMFTFNSKDFPSAEVIDLR